MPINTDEEMRQINKLLGQPGQSNESSIRIINLLTGEEGPEDILEDSINTVVAEAQANGETILIQKKCPNPDTCRFQSEKWHNCIIIARGEIFVSLDVVDTMMDMIMRRLFSGR